MSPSTKPPPSPTTTTSSTTPTHDTLPTSLLLSYLHTTNHLDTLHATLLDTLSRTGWTTRVRRLAVELIRSKKVTRFEDVVEMIVGLAGEKGKEREQEKGKGKGVSNGMENGVASGGGKKRKADDGEDGVQVNGTSNKKAKTEKHAIENGNGKDKDANRDKSEDKNSKSNGVKPSTSGPSSGSGQQEYDVRIPSAVVSQGAKFLRDTLDDLVTFGPDSEDTGEEDDGDNKKMTNGKTR